MAQTWGAWWGLDLVRTILGWIDWVFFQLLGWVYEVFYAVANAELFSGETVYNFIGRIQLILGIFMVFKLTIMILKAMVNPDYINDKTMGASSLITRIITSLVMLSLIMPLNIPSPKNRFEVEVNNNGIMFGTLYSLQKRVLENDVLGQLILGNDAPRRASDGTVVSSRLPGIKDKFISTIAKGFVQRNHKEQGSDDFMCPDNDMVKDNGYENATVTDLFLDHLNDECGNKFLVFGTNYYAFAYVPIVGGIVAIIFTILFAVFSIDIAIRAIKLSVLRLIAPIPIISYMEPGQEKKGAFANWTKILISTYLDLFIRLAMVYFALFLIDDIIKNGLIMNGSMGVGGITGVVAFIVICIGLLMFAKMAPKFITDALGIQTHMSNIGLNSFLAGATAGIGTLAAGGGAAKAFSNMYNAGHNTAKENVEAINSGKAAAPATSNFGKYASKTLQQRTGDKSRTFDLGGALDHWSDAKMADRYVPGDEISKQKKLLADLGAEKNSVDNKLSNAMASKQSLLNRQGNVNSNLAQALSDKERVNRQKANLEALRKDNKISAADFSKMYATADAEMAGIEAKEASLRSENDSITADLNSLNSSIDDYRQKQYDLEVRITQESDNLKDAKESRGYMVGKDEKFPANAPFRAGTMEAAGQQASETSQGAPGAGFNVNSGETGNAGQFGRH